jgi:hypothetical protein
MVEDEAMTYKIKSKKKLGKEDKWLKDWYNFEKKTSRNPFL